jgi:hypothetical protein
VLVSIAAGAVRGNADRPGVVPTHDIRVTVPRLDVHSMVVGELEGEAPR